MNKGLHGNIGRAFSGFFRLSRKGQPETPKNSPGQDEAQSRYGRGTILLWTEPCPAMDGTQSSTGGATGVAKPPNELPIYNTRARMRFLDKHIQCPANERKSKKLSKDIKATKKGKTCLSFLFILQPPHRTESAVSILYSVSIGLPHENLPPIDDVQSFLQVAGGTLRHSPAAEVVDTAVRLRPSG